MRRVIAWYSCGATSLIAAQMALDKWGPDVVDVVYCDTGSEHRDNERFLEDSERFLGVEIIKLKSEKYKDIWDVFEKTRWLVGVGGARCTTELKKKLRTAYQQPDDIHVFGYDSSEGERIKNFRNNNHEVTLVTPLYDAGISKAECIQAIIDAGIEIPAMYKLGFSNNNCVGCVKGGITYWLHVKKVFPEEFDRMAKLERKLNATVCKRYIKGKRTRWFLDQLEPEHARGRKMLDISCGMSCGGQEEFKDE